MDRVYPTASIPLARFDLFLVVQKVGFKNYENLIFINFLGFFVLIEYDLITRSVVTNDTCHMIYIT